MNATNKIMKIGVLVVVVRMVRIVIIPNSFKDTTLGIGGKGILVQNNAI
jgi:hypothetical protein